MTVPSPRIGPFVVGRQLGRGGVGVVHAAARSQGPEVALKLLPSDLTADRQFRARFAREARVLSALTSPHVLPVRAFGEEAGRLYLASDLVPDGDLERMLRTHGAPPITLAIQLVLQAAQGLADAHDAGLVHGALKPANVMLRREGSGFRACLTDFGTAHGGGTARVPGSARWAAPELHSGAQPTVASDVYSMGCVLWAALSGQPPYEGETEFQLAWAHLHSAPRQLAGGAPLVLALNALLRRALDKDPRRRHGSAHALRDDLRHALSLAGPRGGVAPAVPAPRDLPPVGPPPRRNRMRSVAAVAGGLAAAVALGAAGTLAALDTFGTDSPPASAAVSGAGSGSAGVVGPAPVLNNEALAVNAIADAFTTQLLVDHENARCIAGRWVEEMGLPMLLDAGVLADDMSFREHDLEQADPALKASLAGATRTCLS